MSRPEKRLNGIMRQEQPYILTDEYPGPRIRKDTHRMNADRPECDDLPKIVLGPEGAHSFTMRDAPSPLPSNMEAIITTLMVAVLVMLCAAIALLIWRIDWICAYLWNLGS